MESYLLIQHPFSPTIPQHPHPHPYLTKLVNHVFMILSYCITYKAISLPLVAAVASAAAVAVASAAEVTVAEGVCGGGGGGGGGGGDGGCGDGGGGGATAAVSTTSDLTRFGLRNLNFFKYCIFTIV